MKKQQASVPTKVLTNNVLCNVLLLILCDLLTYGNRLLYTVCKKTIHFVLLANFLEISGYWNKIFWTVYMQEYGYCAMVKIVCWLDIVVRMSVKLVTVSCRVECEHLITLGK